MFFHCFINFFLYLSVMKKKDQTVEELIMKSHYLTALEIESKANTPLSEMEREAYLEVIQDLRESVHSTNEMVKSLQDELSRSNRNQEKNNQLITDLRSTISDLQKKLAERDRELSDLRDQNNP